MGLENGDEFTTGGHGHAAIEAWLQLRLQLLNHGGAILAATDEFIQGKDSGLGRETSRYSLSWAVEAWAMIEAVGLGIGSPAIAELSVGLSHIQL